MHLSAGVPRSGRGGVSFPREEEILMSRGRQRESPEIRLVETAQGEVTLLIDGGQAMQEWERDLMRESAEILCRHGAEFLEAGLGLGLSALVIAGHPNTRRHVVIEKYPRVIELFQERHPAPPAPLEIVCADFFDYVRDLPAASFDGIFFDPALPDALWEDQELWDEVMPSMVRSLRPGGVFIPVFSTIPVLKKQHVRFFDRVVVERRPFRAYATTGYTSAPVGDAFIQCFSHPSSAAGQDQGASRDLAMRTTGSSTPSGSRSLKRSSA